MGYATDFDVAALAHDLRHNCHVTDTDSFLSKVLPAPEECVSAIYGTLVAQGLYDESKRQWLGHDLANQREPFRGDFRDLFVHRAEAIRLACQTLSEGGNDYVDGSWIRRADASLLTPSHGVTDDDDDDRGISKLPEILNVSRPKDHCDWNEKIARLSEQSELREKVRRFSYYMSCLCRLLIHRSQDWGQWTNHRTMKKMLPCRWSVSIRHY